MPNNSHGGSHCARWPEVPLGCGGGEGRRRGRCKAGKSNELCCHTLTETANPYPEVGSTPARRSAEGQAVKPALMAALRTSRSGLSYRQAPQSPWQYGWSLKIARRVDQRPAGRAIAEVINFSSGGVVSDLEETSPRVRISPEIVYA